MESRTSWILRVVSLGALGLVSVGCPNPNTYTTPRTVGSGNFSHSIAAEAWGFSVPSTTAGTTTTLSGTFPTFPTYTLRIGAGDSAEIGLRIANMTSLGADVKWNFVRSGSFDLAIDPGGQIFRLGTTASDGNGGTVATSVSVAYFHIPLLVGLNVSRAVSIVFTPGVTFGVASGSAITSASGQDQASATTGAIGRAGIGLDMRISRGFALHPEVTFLRSFGSDATILYLFGLGFNFGSLPNYDDVGGGGPPPPPPPGWGPPPEAAPPPQAAPPPPATPPPA